MDLTVFRQLQRNSSIYPKVNFIICQKRQLFLIMLLIYLFITLTVDYDYWYAPFLSLMAYFMMLTVFGKRFTVRNDCGSNCFVRVSGSKAIFSIRLLSGNTRFQSLTTVLLICFLTFSAILPLYLPKVHHLSRKRVNRSENILMMKGFMTHSMSIN